jgi:hypothetical protein
MIYIFHGDNQELSRKAFSDAMNKYKDCDVLNLDSKNAEEIAISQFLNSQSFISPNKLLCISGFFSITKSKLDKILKVIENSPQTDVLIWQDKTLNATQLKLLPKSTINHYRADNHLFLCLNQIKPKNLRNFLKLYQKVISAGLYDLFLYMLKNNLRKKIGASAFNPDLLKKTYLNLIELDFQNKTGTLSIAKEIALERLMIKLLS